MDDVLPIFSSESATLRDLTLCAAIAIDKMLLLRGESTEITETRRQVEILVAEVSQRHGRTPEEVRALLVRIRPEMANYANPADSRVTSAA